MSKEKRPVLIRYFKAARGDFFISTLIPVFIAVGAALYYCAHISWALLPLITLGVVSLHALVNLTNEYYDYKKGIDKEAGPVHLLPSGEVSLNEVKFLSLLTFIISSSVMLILWRYRSSLILVLGIIGISGGYFYTAPPLAYKYKSLGDIMIFFLMGPLLMVGLFYSLTGVISVFPLIASFPQGSLITAVLNANNIRDMEKDRAASVRTLPILLGRKCAANIYACALILSFLWIMLFIILGVFPPSAAFVLLFIPNALNLISAVRAPSSDIKMIDLETLKLYIGVNTVLGVSFIIGALL